MARPMINAALQATTLACCSNILAQFIEAYEEKRPVTFDFGQLIRFAVLTILTAPPNFYWQAWLERVFPGWKSPTPRRGDIELGDDAAFKEDPSYTEPERKRLSWRNTACKWLIDCMTLGALFNTAAFLIIMGLLKGQSAQHIQHSLSVETIPIIIAGYKIWPIASVINFTLIPVEKRIVFLSFVGLLWGIYLSLIAART